jgi:hypothetical protein
MKVCDMGNYAYGLVDVYLCFGGILCVRLHGTLLKMKATSFSGILIQFYQAIRRQIQSVIFEYLLVYLTLISCTAIDPLQDTRKGKK